MEQRFFCWSFIVEEAFCPIEGREGMMWCAAHRFHQLTQRINLSRKPKRWTFFSLASANLQRWTKNFFTSCFVEFPANDKPKSTFDSSNRKLAKKSKRRRSFLALNEQVLLLFVSIVALFSEKDLSTEFRQELVLSSFASSRAEPRLCRN